MLVLTRKLNEEIIINGNIRIVIADIQSGRVKIGVVAPRHVRVDRSEIAERKAEFGEGEPEELLLKSR